MEQQKFIETVELIKEIAAANCNRISKEQVDAKLCEAGMELDDAKLRMVYAYLKTSKIVVDGDDSVAASNDEAEMSDDNEAREEAQNADSRGEASLEDKDDEVVKIYQADIKSVVALNEDEMLCVMERLAKAGEMADDVLTGACDSVKSDREALINTFLKDVVRWVKEYAGGSVLMTDLIQEGNVGLMMGIAEFDYLAALSSDKPVKKLKDYLKKSVREAALSVIYEQEGENNVGFKIAGRVNAVNDCAKNLAEDLGRKVTVEEIATEMELTVDEVREIVDLSANKIEYIN